MNIGFQERQLLLTGIIKEGFIEEGGIGMGLKELESGEKLFLESSDETWWRDYQDAIWSIEETMENQIRNIL